MPLFKLKDSVEASVVPGRGQIVMEGQAAFDARMGDVQLNLDAGISEQDLTEDNIKLCSVVIPAKVFLANFEGVDDRAKLMLRNVQIASAKVEKEEAKAAEAAAKRPQGPQGGRPPMVMGADGKPVPQGRR